MLWTPCIAVWVVSLLIFGDGLNCVTVPNFIEVAQTEADVNFNIMLLWLENAYSRPFLGFLWHISPNDGTHRPNPQKTVLGLNHVI